MDRPTKQNEPEDNCQHELNDGPEQPALKQLTEARNEEATESSEDVSRRSLTRHACPL